jgi:monothiol glutaredoxin
MSTENTLEKIKSQIASNSIILYMKGNPDSPRCGFSAKAVNALQSCHAQFATVDVLENPDIRKTLPEYANWPTFPQLYINGELIGGCDIILELYSSGELLEMVNQAKSV